MLDLTSATPLSVGAQRLIRADAAAILREVWQSWPKTLTTDTEEEPDER